MVIPLTDNPEPARGEGGGALAVLTTVDQILSSASNALILFTLAQISTADEFGTIALIVPIVAVCIGFNRGSLGTPLLLSSHLKRHEIAVESGYAVSWSLGIGVVAGIAIAGGGVAMNQASVALAFAVCIPFVLAQDVLRMAAIAMQRPGRAAVADAMWTTIMLVTFLANVVGVGISAPATVYIWGVSGLASAMLLAFWTGAIVRTHRILAWWHTYWPARVRFGSLPAFSQVGVLVVTGVAVATAGSVAAAGIRGAMTMFGPITTVIAALPMVFVPHAARTRHSVDARSQWRQLVKISAVTAGTTLLATVCLTHVPGALGTALLGQSWEETLWLVPFIGTQWAAMAWLTSVNTFFQSQGASAAVVRLNLSHMALQISLCVLAGLVFRTAVAIGVALAVSGWLIAVIGTGSVQVWLRRRDQACALGSGLVAGAADGVLAR